MCTCGGRKKVAGDHKERMEKVKIYNMWEWTKIINVLCINNLSFHIKWK